MLEWKERETFDYVFSIVNNIICTKKLIETGINPKITDLLLPSLIVNFGPPLIANSIYVKYHLTSDKLILYFAGFLLSTLVYSNNFIMFILAEVPVISRFFSLVKLKNSTQDTFKLISWQIASNLARICLLNLVMKKKLKIKMREIANMIFMYGGVVILRVYSLNDYYTIVIANIVPILYSACELIFMEKKKKVKKEVVKEEIEEKIPKKKVKRKASVVNKKNK